MDALWQGFGVALSPVNLWWALAGATLGTAVGVLPGIGPALTVALLLPVTYTLDPTAALIMFAGIYYGAMYGGSTTSILLNTPGESATVVTAIEGHLMARRGRGGAALSTAAIGSFVAGTLATVALSAAALPLARLALVFGPAEYCALMVVAFVMIAGMLGDSPLSGFVSLCIGLVLGMVGIDALTGEARFTFGVAYLLDGIDVVIVAVGLFAVGETLTAVAQGRAAAEVLPIRGRVWMTAAEWRRSWRPWLRGSAIGFPLGALPAGGSELPTLVSYAIERRLAQRPRGIWSRCHRRRRRSRSGQQCRGRWHAGPALDAWPADISDRRDSTRGVSAVRVATGTAALRPRAGAGVGSHRESLYRERDAARAESPVGAGVGDAAVDPTAAALRGNPRDRRARRLQRASFGWRPAVAGGHGTPRVRLAAARGAAGPGDDRAHSWADGRPAASSSAGDRRRGLDGGGDAPNHGRATAVCRSDGALAIAARNGESSRQPRVARAAILEARTVAQWIVHRSF